MNLEAAILSKEGIDGSMVINPIVNIAEQPHFITDGMDAFGRYLYVLNSGIR